MHTRQSSQQAKDPDARSHPHTPAEQQMPKSVKTPTHATALIQRAAVDPRSLTRAEVMQLQRTVGNRAVGQLLAHNTPRQLQQESENRTGLPDRLKAGIESLSGLDMSDVRVHYNSTKPAAVQALAYTQGTEIHVAPGQEHHLPHEAWHVVQQAQGRVPPIRQMKGGVSVNDNAGLEKEAEAMGAEALQMRRSDRIATRAAAPRKMFSSGTTLVQRKAQPEQQFSGRDQKTIGVGEKMILRVSSVLANQHRGKLEWIDNSSTPNTGQLSQTDADGNAEFTAQDTTGPVTLICRTRHIQQTLEQAAFRIAAPTGGHMAQAPGTQIRHLADHWNVSFVGNQFLHPQNVSFHNIEFREEQAPAQYQPSKNDWLALTPDHKQGPWVDVEAATSAQKGSQISGDDWVSSGQHQGLPRQNQTDPIQWNQRPPGQPATMTWSIPWSWRLKGTSGTGKEFTTVDHVAYDYGNGEARLTKGGVDVRASATDQPQWFYPNTQDNIDRIKYYYDPSRHTPGYGGQWQHVETRLGNLPPFALADLIAMAREDTWAPHEGLDPHMTLDDLITREAQLWGVPVP